MYGKFFASTYTGSMYGAGPDVFAVWGYVIANAVDGQVELNPRLLSATLGASEERILAAIDFLCSEDPHSRSTIDNGRRLVKEGTFAYRVPTHEHYRSIRNEEERREYNRLKKAEQRQRERERAKSSGESMTSDESTHKSTMSANTEADTDTEADTEEKEKTSSLEQENCSDHESQRDPTRTKTEGRDQSSPVGLTAKGTDMSLDAGSLARGMIDGGALSSWPMTKHTIDIAEEGIKAVMRVMEQRGVNWCAAEAADFLSDCIVRDHGPGVPIKPCYLANRDWMKELEEAKVRPIAHSPSSEKKAPSDEAERLAELLRTEILHNKSDYRITQAHLRKWAVTADRMIRLDGRTEEQIANLIRWVQHDEFWMANVLSMDTLREKFDQLELKRAHAGGKPTVVTERHAGFSQRDYRDGLQANGDGTFQL